MVRRIPQRTSRMQLRLSKVKESLAYKLIDKRIDEYVTLNRRHTESSSQRVSILGQFLQRYHKHHNKVVPQTIEEGRLHRNAA